MPATIGYHYVRSAYGLWLPGDHRGHWSEAWDQQIGYVEPRTLHAGDPIRHRMAEERMKHMPVRWSLEVQRAIIAAAQLCEAESDWTIAAYGIEETHLHLALTYTTRDIDGVAKWLGQRMTKAVHQQVAHDGPVFCKGHWLEFVVDDAHWGHLLAYIDRHNKADDATSGLTDDIDAFVASIDAWR